MERRREVLAFEEEGDVRRREVLAYDFNLSRAGGVREVVEVGRESVRGAVQLCS